MRSSRTTGFTLVELMIVVAIIGILAALAVPNFIKFQAKAKQSEAKTSLRAYFAAQKAYFAEHDEFTANLGGLAFAPERGNRYSYRSAVTPAIWSTRDSATIVNSTGADGIEVDCYKLGGGCTLRPSRAGPMATFTIAYSGATVGPADTGVTSGPNGGYVMEAIGTIDNDTDNDVWLISSGTITIAAGPCADAVNGVPAVAVTIYDDVSCP